MHIFLTTDRLMLRRFTQADVDLLYDLDGDPDVMHFITGGRATPREVIEREVLPKILGDYERHAGFGYWAAIERSTGEFLGWFEFRPREDRPVDEIELGYRLRKRAWGRGYATEGARALIDKGFTELGVQRVFAETMAVNAGSRRVMEKAGLRLVRTFHAPWVGDPIEGIELGEVECALDRADWERNRHDQPR